MKLKTLEEQLKIIDKLLNQYNSIKHKKREDKEEFINEINGISLWESDTFSVKIPKLINYDQSSSLNQIVNEIYIQLRIAKDSLYFMRKLQKKIFNGKLYSFRKELGHGGNGTVYLIEDSDNQLYALKILQVKIKNGKPVKKTIDRFKDEITVVTANLKGNIGVLPIIDYHIQGTNKGDISWYTMPIAIPLREYKFKSVEEKIKAFLELANTLKQLHIQNITHRDIKPDNLYFYNSHFVFSDFGLTDFPHKSAKTVKKERIGPWQTIAPEMERNPEKSDFKAADVYSFAKTLWMIVTENYDCFEGQYSFMTEYMDISKYINTRNEYDNGKKIYLAPLHKILFNCTSNKPEERFKIEEVIEYFNKWLLFTTDSEKGDSFEWEFLKEQLFRFPVEKAIWKGRDSIYSVLDIVTRTPYLNHTFFPGKGGLYLNNVKTYLDDYIEFDFGAPYIGKPKLLEFHSFPISLFNYFYLVTDDFGSDYEFHKYKNKLPFEETVCELENGVFKESWYLNYKEYDGIEIPATARNVILLNKGIYVIFCHSSPYNLYDRDFCFDSYSAYQTKFNSSEKFEKFVKTFLVEYLLVIKHKKSISDIINFNELLYPSNDNFIKEKKKKYRDDDMVLFLKQSIFNYHCLYNDTVAYNYYLEIQLSDGNYVFTKDNNFIRYDTSVQFHTYLEDSKRIKNIEQQIKLFSEINEVYRLIRSIKKILRHHFKKDFTMPKFCLKGKFVKLPTKRYFSFDDVKNAFLKGDDFSDSYIVVNPDMTVECIKANQLKDSTIGKYCCIDWQGIDAHENICGNPELSEIIVRNEYKELLSHISHDLKELSGIRCLVETEYERDDSEIKEELDHL